MGQILVYFPIFSTDIDYIYIGNYFLDRESLIPSLELQRMIFPRIEESRTMSDSPPMGQRDVAMQCFLDLLEWFRIVLLQDVVFLRQKFPSMPLWLQSPFNQSAFEEFSTRLLHEAKHGNDPKYIQIAKIIPNLTHLLRDQFGNTLNVMDTYHNSGEIRMDRIETVLTECLEHMKPMSSFMTRLCGEGVVTRTLITAEPVSLNNPVPTPPFITSTITAENSSSIQENRIPQYRLNPTITTVMQLWEEYDRGFIPAIGMPRGPAIRDLNEQFGTKWRADDKYRKPYSRRKLIWEAIIRASTNLNLPPNTVTEKIQRWQDNNKYTLNKIHNLLSTLSSDSPGLWGINDVELPHII
jgi:Transcriptional activator of glycolytic enzymes/Centromere DNA-binding protein complex CBF3 subunit, domain 2